MILQQLLTAAASFAAAVNTSQIVSAIKGTPESL